MIRAAAVLTVAVLVFGGAASATTMPTLTVPVNVVLKAKAVKLSATSVARGYYVRFQVRNLTPHKRTFSVAGTKIVVPARKLRLMAIEFDVRGKYRYVSRGRGSAVRGIFRVS